MAYLHPDKVIAIQAILSKKGAKKKSASGEMVARLAAHYFQQGLRGHTYTGPR